MYVNVFLAIHICSLPEDNIVPSKQSKIPLSLQQEVIVYDLCGYLLKTRGHKMLECESCCASVKCTQENLPNIEAVKLTATKNRGGLIFASEIMFSFFFQNRTSDRRTFFKWFSYLYERLI